MAADLVTLPNLRALRRAKCWSQRELAQRTGISYHTIWRLERGKSAQWRTISRLAAALEVRYEDLAQAAQ